MVPYEGGNGIRNPQQIGQSVTAGIVSGLHRANVGLEPYEDFIQTDAAIYPGNSALVDLRGDLVGISTAFIAVADAGRCKVGKNNPGMSFAIPINMANALIDQMLEFGDIRRGALGFTYDDFTSARSRDYAGATRMWRRTDRASLEKKPSTRLSHEPCLGVKVNSKRPAGRHAGTQRRRPADQAGAAADRRSRGICRVAAGRQVDPARRDGGTRAERTHSASAVVEATTKYRGAAGRHQPETEGSWCLPNATRISRERARRRIWSPPRYHVMPARSTSAPARAAQSGNPQPRSPSEARVPLVEGVGSAVALTSGLLRAALS
jgi:hypothetical protein